MVHAGWRRRRQGRSSGEWPQAAAVHAFQPGQPRLRWPDPGAVEPVNHTSAALRQLLLPTGPRGVTRLACPLLHIQFAAQLYPVSIDIR